MEEMFSDRIKDVPKSFIREILKVTLDPSIISFAGGLPNRDLFPTEQIRLTTEKVFQLHGTDLYQYSNSEGLLELRETIARRYKETKNLDIDPQQIIITNGGQQGLDLLGKVLLNNNDEVLIEEPGYLGAIQSFSIFRPQFIPIKVHDEGMDLEQLQKADISETTKLMYTVPNFQNPSGITYTEENRQAIARVAEQNDFFIIEDDPYGELRFTGKSQPSFHTMIPEKTVMLGSFSKVVVPGFRIGWIVAPEQLRQKLLVAKQAADLHTCNFTQYIINRFLVDYDLNDHIEKIRKAYGSQCAAMLAGIEKYFPDGVTHTRPEGGMFLWGRLPAGISALDLFELAVKEKVVFVPGDPFYTNSTNCSDFRLNFSCVDEQGIMVGIERLGKAIEQLLQ